MRLPWQNQQSTQSANPALPVHSPSPAGGSFPRAFSASSGQPSANVYSSGLGNTGFGVGSQSIDLVSEEMESSSIQMLRSVPKQELIMPEYQFVACFLIFLVLVETQNN